MCSAAYQVSSCVSCYCYLGAVTLLWKILDEAEAINAENLASSHGGVLMYLW